MYDKILLGKNELPHIVAIEPEDNFATIYQEIDGQIQSSIVPNERWILSSDKPTREWKELKGNLYYKYGKKYSEFSDWLQEKNILRRQRYNIFTVNSADESLMIKDGYTFFKDMQLSNVSSIAFDIEATGLTHDDSAQVLLISGIYRSGLGVVEEKLFAYDDYEDEVQFLNAFCTWVREKNPSVLLGYNITSYDLPYMNYCMERNGFSLNLGRNNSALQFENFERKYRVDGSRELTYFRPKIYGRQIIDVYFLSLKYDIARNYESYSLKYIIKYENLEAKDRVFYDASQIRFTYKDPIEWAKIKEYCKGDALDVLRLYDLMAPTYFLLAQYVPKSFQSIIETASGSQLNSIMIRAYLQEAHSLPKADQHHEYEGGISEGNVGIYKYGWKVDARSMYPSIIISNKLYNKSKDPYGYLLHITETMTKARLENRAMYEKTGERKYRDQSDLSKVIINSLYGFMGASGLLFNWIEGAAKVTAEGRTIITKAMEWAKHKDFQLINVDTDSITITKNKDLPEEYRNELLANLNSQYPKDIVFTHDGYFQDVIVVAAKNYVLYDGKKLKIKGSSLKSPGLSLALREFMTSVFWSIIKKENNYNELYLKYIKEIHTMPDIKRWSTRKTITEKTLNSERANESKIRDAIEGSEYTEGARVWVYFKSDDTLDLAENFKGDYSKERLLEGLFKAGSRFKLILDTKRHFPNLKLKRNKGLLEQLCA
jgi:DNA polymerase elongation subunit (family B)